MGRVACVFMPAIIPGGTIKVCSTWGKDFRSRNNSFLVSNTGLISGSARRSLPVPVDFLNSSSTERIRNFRQIIKSATWWLRALFKTPLLHNLGALSSNYASRFITKHDDLPSYSKDIQHTRCKRAVKTQTLGWTEGSEESRLLPKRPKSPNCCLHGNWSPNQADRKAQLLLTRKLTGQSAKSNGPCWQCVTLLRRKSRGTKVAQNSCKRL